MVSGWCCSPTASDPQYQEWHFTDSFNGVDIGAVVFLWLYSDKDFASGITGEAGPSIFRCAPAFWTMQELFQSCSVPAGSCVLCPASHGSEALWPCPCHECGCAGVVTRWWLSLGPGMGFPAPWWSSILHSSVGTRVKGLVHTDVVCTGARKESRSTLFVSGAVQVHSTAVKE